VRRRSFISAGVSAEPLGPAPPLYQLIIAGPTRDLPAPRVAQFRERPDIRYVFGHDQVAHHQPGPAHHLGSGNGYLFPGRGCFAQAVLPLPFADASLWCRADFQLDVAHVPPAGDLDQSHVWTLPANRVGGLKRVAGVSR
jgi:hypothetical protein